MDMNTDDRIIQNHQIITNSNTLPDFVNSSLPQV